MFRYRAGQFCTFRVNVGGEELLRSYSMSSAPDVDDDLTVTVKRVPDGAVSNWFNDAVTEGDVLAVTKPMGVFCVRDHDAAVIAFCGGSGVTPVMSITKSVLQSTSRPIKLFYANRDADSIIFDAELRLLQEKHDGQLTVQHHLDVDRGFVDAAEIEAFADADTDADYYICGPGPFMDLVEATLLGRGVPRDRIMIERFTPAGETADAAASDVGGEDETGAVPAEVTIILKHTRTTIEYHPGDTVLTTARRGGLQPPFSCEAGNCATCMAVLREGAATMRVNDALTDEEVADGWILTCQAVPRGGSPVVVEYEEL
jgi:ferredoxin-NADP reductase